MSKQAEAELILKLYELRREDTMRKARDWYFREFNPESKADIDKAMFSEHSGHLRMVWSYWDMAAALVNHGAISVEFFTDTNGEHLSAFSKLEPFLEEMRATVGPQFMGSLEKLVDATPNGRQRVAALGERYKRILATLAEQAKQASNTPVAAP